MRKYLRTERGERIDQPDLQHGVEASAREQQDDLIDALLIGRDNDDAQATPRSFIVKGFAMDSPSGKIVRVTKGDGVAVLPYREKGEVRYGFLAVGGDSAKSYSIASYPSGVVYGIYIRAELRDADFQNRPFWNAVGTPGEYARSIATRRAEGWQLAVEQVSPGLDWYKIGEVDYDTMAFTDLRDFMFEGKDANDFAVVDAEWGGEDDRDDTRATAGVFGLRRAIRALQRQVQDIIGGGTKWWVSPQAGNASGSGARSLTQLNSEKLARNGAQTMQGHIIPDGDDTRDLGSLSASWRKLYTKAIRLAEDTTEAVLGVVRADNTKLAAIISDLTGSTQTAHLYIGPALDGGNTSIGFVVNATWQSGSNDWTNWSPHTSYFAYLSTNGLRVYAHDAGVSSTWAHTASNTTWKLLSRTTLTSAIFSQDLTAGNWTVTGSNIENTTTGNSLIYLSKGEGAANRGAIQNSPTLGNGGNTALLDLFAGDAGTGRIRLRGTSNRLALYCEGTNGFFVRTVSSSVGSGTISAGTTAGGTESFAAPTGFNIKDTTAVILSADIVYGGDYPELDGLIWSIQLTGTDNQVFISYTNVVGTAQPGSSRTFDFRIVFMALP